MRHALGYSPFFVNCTQLNLNNCKLFSLYKIFQGSKTVECIECKKNKHEVERFPIAFGIVLVSMQITLYPFHQTELSWLFYDFSNCFDSFYTLFMIS